MANKVAEISNDLWGMAVSENTRQREAVDRRRFLKGAATVAWAAPVIVTLSASPAYARCKPQGEVCSSLGAGGTCGTGNCCTGLTCQPSSDLQSNECLCQ